MLDPQAQNSYAYARGNPLRFKDPEGLWYREFVTGQQSWSSFQLELGQAANQLAADDPVWNYAFKHPTKTSAAVAVGGTAAAYVGAGGFLAGGATNIVIGGLNAYGNLQTTQSYLLYRATGSPIARADFFFNVGTSIIGAAGTKQQQAALNQLSAALTALNTFLTDAIKTQASADAKKKPAN